MNASPDHHDAAPAASCGIAAHAMVEARLSEIVALRDAAAPPGVPAPPPRFLRHCDEHAVVGMHAVLRALAARGPAPDVSRDAVVAASCQLGRLAAARTLANLATGGGVSVSPHVVPQCSLHSVAGAVSVGLGMHGPHLGVGGGADAFAEGLFAAATLVESPASAGDPPCVWVVATEWDEEPAIDPSGAVVGDPSCRALALALERAGAAGSSAPLSLSLHVPAVPRRGPAPQPAAGRLAGFARALDMCRDGTALVSWVIECPWGAEIRVAGRARCRERVPFAVPLRGAA